jgi:hypothetical protein
MRNLSVWRRVAHSQTLLHCRQTNLSLQQRQDRRLTLFGDAKFANIVPGPDVVFACFPCGRSRKEVGRRRSWRVMHFASFIDFKVVLGALVDHPSSATIVFSIREDG